jgi:hypothetical protein
MKKKISVIGIMFLLMISIASASVLDYYGKIEGSADVKGPTFYAAPENKLLINKEPTSYATYEIKDGETEIFWTSESLGGIGFNYVPKADLYIRASVSDTLPKQLELTFGYSNTTGDMNDICSQSVSINSTVLDNYHIICEGSKTLSNVNYFYYMIRGKGDVTANYTIVVGSSEGYTRVEVDKA